MRKMTLVLIAVLAVTAHAFAEEKEDGWIRLFDGKSFEGWKASENPAGSWKIEDGAIVAFGPRSHLFYVGQEQPFVNFEFQAEVMTKPGSNSGIYFHSKFQESGWPKFGYEAQVNNTHRDPKKTGSLYAVKDVLKAPAKDNEWFKYYIRVEGKRVLIKIDDKTVLDYTEPAGKRAGNDFTRVLDRGTFALQAHDPKSTVMYKNLQARRLPD